MAALGAVIFASWIYLMAGAGTGMSIMAMTSWSMAIGAPEALSMALATPVDWTPSYAVSMLLMWWVMMIAMMLPSAAPVILLHARVSGTEGSILPNAAFVAGYALAWGGFSLSAAALQWLFERVGVLSPYMMNTSSNIFAGAVLIFAGAYQLSPLKRACLSNCHSPLAFLSHHWQPGTWGGLRMGLHHGTYCLGCCAGLMAILFFGGIMNLYWIAGLALLVLLEKLLPAGAKLPWLTGPALIIWGVSFLARAWS
jgi:predicted metal-binding membrane protein